MTMLHLRHDERPVSGNGSRFPFARVVGRLRAAFKMLHEAIVVAKLRRLQNELMFHAGVHENWPSQTDADAAKFPRRPLILGDKWDF